MLASLPQLAPFVSEGESGALVIRVPHPAIPCGLVLSTQGDEVTIGFRQWHTHGESLGGTTADEHIQAAVRFVKRILDGDVQIAISHVDGEFVDAWVTDDPDKERRYMQPNERLRTGTWSALAA